MLYDVLGWRTIFSACGCNTADVYCKSEVTWSVFDIVGVQADIVFGVEQFDKRAAGHIIELRLSAVTDWTQQQHK